MNANFEQYASEQLTGHKIQVDTEALWANIYPRVKPAKDNRKVLGFLFLGLFLGLTTLGGYYYKNTSNTTIVAGQNLALATDVPTPVISNQVTGKEIIRETTITETEAISTKAEAIVAIQNTTKEASAKQSNLNTKTTSSARSAQAKTTGNKGTILPLSNKPASLQPSIFLPLAAEKDKDNLSDNDFSADNTILVPKRNFTSAAMLPTLLPGVINYNLFTDVDITSFTPKLKSVLAGNVLPKEDKKKRKNTPDIFRDIKFGMGLYTGLSRSNSDLEAKTGSATPFVVARTFSEKQLETIHFGLNAFIQTDKGLYLRTGAEYTRIGSLFSRNAEQVTMDTTQGIIKYEISGISGDTINIIEGDVIVTRTTRYIKKSYNYFHLIDVPVIFGYNFGENDDTWRIGLEAGIYANVFLKNKGEIPLETDGSFYDLADDPQKWYKTNIGISPFVGVNIAYNVSQNIQLHFSPNFRFNAVYSTDANPIKEKHGNLGVQAGIRYFFD